MAKVLRRKHTHKDMFICDILDATPKDDIGSMEHPFFSLSKNPDHRIRKYEHNGEYIKIAPSAYGMATIFDKDILIFAMSQLIAKINKGEKTSQTIQFSAYDLLISTERRIDGRSYERLKAAFDRLQGTSITTCIRAGGKEITRGFGLIDYWEIIRETPKGRMEGLELKLSDWLYEAILAKEVLSISPDYFRLGKPLERRIYELCRKHCGKQTKIIIGLDKLHKKTGSSASFNKFQELIKTAIEGDNLPDYHIALCENNKRNLVIRPRAPSAPISQSNKPRLKSQTYENAARILHGSGLDKYTVFEDWWLWAKGREPPKSWDAAYIGFCKMQIS